MSGISDSACPAAEPKSGIGHRRMQTKWGSTAMPALTSIRGIAAWWVVLYHFREAIPAWVPDCFKAIAGQGYLAVDLFFQLSGFVIALNYAHQFQTLSASGVGNFLLRRLARIYPLHAVMLVAYLATPLAILLLSSHGALGERFGLGYFVMSACLVQNWGFTSGLDWNVPAWSISTEWFAYLLFPLLAWASARYLAGSWRALAAAAALFALLGGAAFLTGSGLGGDIPRFGLWRCVLQFSAGTMLWLIVSRYPAEGWRLSLASVISLLGLSSFALWTAPNFVAVPISFCALIYVLTNSSAWPSRLLRWRVLERAGIVSYSTYLSHYLVKEWVKFALVRPGIPAGLPLLVFIVLVIFASRFLYARVEEPGRQLWRLLGKGARGPLDGSDMTARQASGQFTS